MRFLIVLRADAIGRLFEHEELVFECRGDGEPHRRRLVDHTAQQAARTDCLGRVGEFAQEERHVIFERQQASGRRKHACGGIGVARMPTGVGDVVVELVVRIPAHDDVAEAEALFENAEELVARDVFAAQDSIDVRDAELDLADA